MEALCKIKHGTEKEEEKETGEQNDKSGAQVFFLNPNVSQFQPRDGALSPLI